MRAIAIGLMLLTSVDLSEVDSDEALRRYQQQEHARLLAGGTLHQCDFKAYTGSSGKIVVRSEPKDDASVVGTLPASTYDPDIDAQVGTDLDVIEARDGWFRVLSYDPFPSVKGWIPGRYIEFDLQTDFVHAAPDANSAVVATSWDLPDGGGRMFFTWREPSDCKGKWVKARFTGRDGIERDGWAAGVCADQYTTCDGVYGGMRPYED